MRRSADLGPIPGNLLNSSIVFSIFISCEDKNNSENKSDDNSFKQNEQSDSDNLAIENEQSNQDSNIEIDDSYIVLEDHFVSKFNEVLLEKKIIEEKSLYEEAAEFFNVPFVNLKDVTIKKEAFLKTSSSDFPPSK